ncbi:hypothetical protein BM221_009926 [Beauveria bassiana]|uniref:Uncharacterized protein n=1 Tax=Beauveria bassiana TaxID=176275 RepID=A0A2N6NA41_BEABA|nr:hypothetical protein BM221_009926 [Beauveria bassiana]
MIGTSLWDYIFIRACIFFLHLIAPVSIIYTLVNVLVGLPFQLPQALQVWLALEASFYLAVYLPYRKYLQKAARHPALPCREDRRKLFKRCHETIPDPVQYLRKWFRGAAEAEIKRENVKDFFRWAFLNTGEIESVDEDELEDSALFGYLPRTPSQCLFQLSLPCRIPHILAPAAYVED